jgi:signal transduction histidine kinase
MAANLRPAVFDDFGLAVAIKLLARDFERSYGIHPTLDLDEGARFAPAIEINLYRIIQEALSNIGKHTEASRVDVVLRRKHDSIHLRITDNGNGFERPMSVRGNQRGGLGLMSMQERAKLAGGDFHIDSESGKGTTISVTVPAVDESTELDNEITTEVHQ